MANHTVPTPRRPYQVDDTTVAYPITYYIAAQSMDIGAEIIILPADIELPNPVSVSIELHQDGSPCGTTSCDGKCDALETTIRRGGALRVGEWIWQAGHSWAVGWHRTGPSTDEKHLQGRIEHLEEDLEHEAGHRHLAEEDLAKLGGRAERLRASLRGLRADHRHLDRLTTRLACVAVTGWTVAIVLALFLITVVSW